MGKKAPFGWTVVLSGSGKVIAYKRDCPADKEHYAEDLAPFTHPTQDAAIKAGKAGHYAYARDTACVR